MNNIIAQPLLFDNKKIRRAIEDGITYYSVIDVIRSIESSKNPQVYWSSLKQRCLEGGIDLFTKCKKVKLPGLDGKMYSSDCAIREKIFEIITYINHKKTSEFRAWLAGLAEAEFQKMESGDSRSWEKIRDKSKSIRNTLTSSLIEHGVPSSNIGDTTNILYRYGFGKTASSYRDYKGLTNQNLRDHMTPTELQITSTMETVLDELMDINNSYGFNMVKEDAIDAGEFGGKMRREMERLLGRPVVSKENNLSSKKKLDTKKDKKLVIE